MALVCATGHPPLPANHGQCAPESESVGTVPHCAVGCSRDDCVVRDSFTIQRHCVKFVGAKYKGEKRGYGRGAAAGPLRRPRGRSRWRTRRRWSGTRTCGGWTWWRCGCGFRTRSGRRNGLGTGASSSASCASSSPRRSSTTTRER
jgi:hypothetical protein